MEILFFLMLGFFLGASIGSFTGVLIDRLPKHESILWPPSHCDNCKKPVQPYDNIPVVSYLLLGGQCRYCKAKIPIKFFLIEAICGLLGILAFYILLKVLLPF